MSHSNPRAEVNFIINLLLLLSLSIITGIGFLIKYTLLPGNERRAVYGDGIELYFLGLDRHEWGEVHLIIGFIFLGLTALHIILHWKTVVHVFHRFFKQKPARFVIALLLAVLCTLIILLPLFLEPQVVERGQGKGQHHSSVLMPIDGPDQ